MYMRVSKEKIDEILHQVQECFVYGRLAMVDSLLEPLVKNVDALEVEDGVKFFILYNYFENAWKLKGFHAEFAYAEKAIEYAEPKAKSTIYQRLASYAIQKGDFDAASKYLELCEQYADGESLQIDVYRTKGVLLFRKRLFEEAREALYEALTKAEAINQRVQCCYINMYLADVYKEMGKHELAFNYLATAEQVACECHNIDLLYKSKIREAKMLYALGRDADVKKVIESAQLHMD